MFVLAMPANVYGQDQLQKYFSDTAVKVKATVKYREAPDLRIHSGFVQNYGQD